MKHKPVAMTVLILCSVIVSTVFAGGLLERDAQRLQRARESHATEIDRAFTTYATNVERANERLGRIYQQTITQYTTRGDIATAEQLQRELDELSKGALKMPFPDDAESPAEPLPPSHVRLIEAMGPTLFNTAGRQAPSSRVAEYDYVVLYFTASWCMPCKRFTPKLIEFYNANRSHGKWEIIVVSGDRTEDAFLKYMNEAKMPWAAVPFHRQEAMEAIHRGGYPRVIVLDREGKMLVRSALARDDGEQTLFNEIRALVRK